MASFIFILLLFHIFNAFGQDHPTYLTDEEFEGVKGKFIAISNTSLPLSSHNDTEISPARRRLTRAGFGTSLWPGAQVPYTLDPNFTAEQRQQVAMAMQAYHDNTCIRFIPRQPSHTSYVNILLDNNVCGLATLCRQNGGQEAKFGGSCVSPGVMVHELGHTLCMGHEQTRMDRDEWVDWNTQICEPHPKDGLTGGLHKLYDYVSIEHYEGECYNGCIIPKQPGVTKCGSGGPLSVLDIEILNEMYGCNSGCLGYRYVNSRNTLNNPVAVGNDANGDTLYSCRAYHQGDIIPGKYNLGRRECHVAWNGGEYSKTGNYIEVLTNPNGARFSWLRTNTRPANAIRGGRSNERETLYVIRCQITTGGRTLWLPGKFQPSTGPYTSFGGSEVRCNGPVEFLVCT